MAVDPNKKVQLVVYYKTKKTASLIMKNNINSESDDLQNTNVVYQFSCNNEDCALRKVDYIGMTSTTLSRRLTMHLQEGAPKMHLLQRHGIAVDINILVQNTKIIARAPCRRRLAILESILIKEKRPFLNIQLS